MDAEHPLGSGTSRAAGVDVLSLRWANQGDSRCRHGLPRRDRSAALLGGSLNSSTPYVKDIRWATSPRSKRRFLGRPKGWQPMPGHSSTPASLHKPLAHDESLRRSRNRSHQQSRQCPPPQSSGLGKSRKLMPADQTEWIVSPKGQPFAHPGLKAKPQPTNSSPASAKNEQPATASQTFGDIHQSLWPNE